MRQRDADMNNRKVAVSLPFYFQILRLFSDSALFFEKFEIESSDYVLLVQSESWNIQVKW